MYVDPKAVMFLIGSEMDFEVCPPPTPRKTKILTLQGYLAHKKLPPPLGPYRVTMPKALW